MELRHRAVLSLHSGLLRNGGRIREDRLRRNGTRLRVLAGRRRIDRILLMRLLIVSNHCV